MSARRLTEILVARERLLARVADQRGLVARHSAGLAPALNLIDCTLGAIRYVRRHPATTTAAALTVVLLRGRMLFRLGLRTFGIWRLVQRARVFLRHAGY